MHVYARNMGELVEGIGDEVLFFVGFLALSLAGVVYLSMRPRLRGGAPTFERATPPPRAEDASERGREEEEDGERDPAPGVYVCAHSIFVLILRMQEEIITNSHYV